MQTLKSDTLLVGVVENEIIELTPFEMELIYSIRNRWRFGEIVILVKDGQPYRLKRVQEFIDLEQKSDKI